MGDEKIIVINNMKYLLPIVPSMKWKSVYFSNGWDIKKLDTKPRFISHPLSIKYNYLIIKNNFLIL